MSDLNKNNNPIIIIGGGDNDSLMIELVRINAENQKLEIITIEEAKEKGLIENYITQPPILHELTFTDDFSEVRSARNIRREKSRKSKKRK